MDDCVTLSFPSLLHRIQRRSTNNAAAAAALAELYDLMGERIYSLAAMMLGEGLTAEKVTQDVFLQVWSHADRYQSDTSPLLTQLLTLTRHTTINHLQAAGYRHSEVVFFSNTPAALTSDAEIGIAPTNQWWHTLRVCMGELIEDQRNMLTLSYYWGMSQSEIATKLGMPLETIRLQMKLAMDKLCASWLKTTLKHPFETNEILKF